MKVAVLDMDNLKNPHWNGGQAKVTFEVGRRLAKRHDITVYSSKYPGYENYTRERIKYVHIGLGTNFPRLNNIVYILTLPFVVRRIKADVIVEDFTAPFSTCFTPLFTKIPVIARGSFFAAGDMSRRYGFSFDRIERLGVKLYKYFIALNESDHKKIKAMNPNINSRVIFNGVGEEYFKRQTGEKNYLLYLGRLDINQKGLDLLLEAFSKISHKINDLLFIAGDGRRDEKYRLIKLVHKYKLGNRVSFLGKIVGKEKMNYHSVAKFMLFPSRYEGQSLSALESIALGKPIVCFDIDGFRWLPSDVCLKARAFSVDDFSEKILTLSRDKKLRKELSEKSRRISIKYSWDETAENYEKYIYEIINN